MKDFFFERFLNEKYISNNEKFIQIYIFPLYIVINTDTRLNVLRLGLLCFKFSILNFSFSICLFK